MLIFHFLSVLRTMHCSRTKETIKSRTVKGRKWLSMHAHSSGMFKLCKEIPRLRRLIRGFYELSAAYDLCVQSSTHYLFSLSERCLCFFDSLQCSAVKQVFSREFFGWKWPATHFHCSRAYPLFLLNIFLSLYPLNISDIHNVAVHGQDGDDDGRRQQRIRTLYGTTMWTLVVKLKRPFLGFT